MRPHLQPREPTKGEGISEWDTPWGSDIRSGVPKRAVPRAARDPVAHGKFGIESEHLEVFIAAGQIYFMSVESNTKKFWLIFCML